MGNPCSSCLHWKLFLTHTSNGPGRTAVTREWWHGQEPAQTNLTGQNTPAKKEGTVKTSGADSSSWTLTESDMQTPESQVHTWVTCTPNTKEAQTQRTFSWNVMLLFLTCRGSFVCIHSSSLSVNYKAFIHFLHILPCKKATRKTTGRCCWATALTVETTGLKLPGIPRDKSMPESANSLQQLWELLGMTICLSPAPQKLKTTAHFLITKKHQVLLVYDERFQICWFACWYDR